MAYLELVMVAINHMDDVQAFLLYNMYQMCEHNVQQNLCWRGYQNDHVTKSKVLLIPKCQPYMYPSNVVWLGVEMIHHKHKEDFWRRVIHHATWIAYNPSSSSTYISHWWSCMIIVSLHDNDTTLWQTRLSTIGTIYNVIKD